MSLQHVLLNSKIDINDIGKWKGLYKVYLTCHDGREWHIEKFNIFQVIAKEIFGFYASTRLTHILSEINNEITNYHSITKEEVHLVDRLKTIWSKKHSEAFPIKEMEVFDFKKASHEVFDLLKKAPGIAIGEFHIDPAICKLLIDNMSYLQSLGVKNIFIEHLLKEEADEECREYFSQSSPIMSDTLKSRLTFHDVLAYGLIGPEEKMEYEQAIQLIKEYNEFNLSPEGMDFVTDVINQEAKKPYNYTQLFYAAKAHGMQIIPLDTRANKTYSSPRERCEKWNPFAERHIREHLKNNDGKYLVLCGAAHTAEFEGVPGLDSLLKIPKIKVASSSMLKRPREVLFKDESEGSVVFDYLFAFKT